MSGFDWLVLILGVFLIAAVIAEGWLILHMLGQNGRLLLRLDGFDEQIGLVASGQQVVAPAAPKPVKEQPVRGCHWAPRLPRSSSKAFMAKP